MKIIEIYHQLREVFVLLEFENLKALQPYQLDNLEYNALQLLDLEKGLRMMDLRERLLCDKSKVTRIIDYFENRGLALRQPDPEDRRAFKVFLTPAGLQLREQAQVVMRNALENQFSELTTIQQEQLLSLLVNLRSQLTAEINQG
jgi:DNA-binding MarR family transcriptional regulator